MQPIKTPVTIDSLDKLINRWRCAGEEHFCMELQLATLLRNTMVLAGIESTAELDRWNGLINELVTMGKVMPKPIPVKDGPQTHHLFGHLFNADGSVKDEPGQVRTRSKFSARTSA